MEDCNASTVQGLTASLAISISLIVLEQVLASSKCKSNSMMQFLLNVVHAVRAPQQPAGTWPILAVISTHAHCKRAGLVRRGAGGRGFRPTVHRTRGDAPWGAPEVPRPSYILGVLGPQMGVR